MTGQTKFQRNYKLTILPPDGGAPIIIMPPMTINIDCRRGLTAAMNTLDIDIYNLSRDQQKRIYWDKNVPGQYFTPASKIVPNGSDPGFINITLEAGYGQQTHKIFQGHIQWADSARQGTNVITHIFANTMLDDVLGTQIQTTLPAGTTGAQLLTFLCAQFPNLKIGAIGNFPQIFTKGISLNGTNWDLIRYYAAYYGGTAFIDNGNIYILNNNEVIGGVFIINDATGILETPRRQINLLTVKTFLETGAQVLGQMVQIQSTIMPIYNGIYKVVGLQHRGMISAAICGRMETNFALQAPNQYGAANQPGSGFITVPLAQATAA